MRYFKMNVYVQGENYETKESLIDEPTFRKYQRAVEAGATHLSLDDRIIKITAIKEILPADDIVREYTEMGVSLKSLGLPEVKTLEAPKETPEEKQDRYRKMVDGGKGFGKMLT